MIRIRLPPAEADRLDALFRSTDDLKFRARLPIVRMAHRGRARRDIATDLGVHRKTVTRWLNAYCADGLDGLRPRKAKGTPGQIPRALADEVKRWVIEGPAQQGLDRANWTHFGTRRPPEEGQGHPHRSQRRPAVLRGDRHPAVPAHLPPRPGRPPRAGQGQGGLGRVGKRAAAGELVLLSQDGARFPMVPTLAATLGVKGHRPTVGTRDCKDLLSVFAVVNLVNAVVHANTLESPRDARKKTGLSKTRRMQEAFASHLRHVGRMCPHEKYPRGVLVIDNAPWHRGKPIDEAMAGNPHLEFKRLPSYSPHLNPVERFWKKLRRRATHNRLFDTLADLKASLRASLSYFQTVRHKVKSIIEGRPKRKIAK